MFARKRRRWRPTPAATRYRRNARPSALRARPAVARARARPPRRRPTRSCPTRSPRTRRAAGAAGAQDKGIARPGRDNGQPRAHLPDNEGERPDRRIRPEEAQMPPRKAQRSRPAERGGQAARRPHPAHPRAQRPRLRSGRRRLELRLPADRPAQPRDRGTFGRAAQGRRPGRGRARGAGVPDVRHRGVPC